MMFGNGLVSIFAIVYRRRVPEINAMMMMSY